MCLFNFIIAYIVIQLKHDCCYIKLEVGTYIGYVLFRYVWVVIQLHLYLLCITHMSGKIVNSENIFSNTIWGYNYVCVCSRNIIFLGALLEKILC
jgi:hypothetical protein